MTAKKMALALLATALLTVSAAWAQEGGDMMAEVMKNIMPGEHHAHMADAVGKWKGTGKMWMEPGAEPITNEGTAEIVALLDGRYLQMTFEGTFMGMPFRGIGVDGYDNMKKKHVGSWIDNFGTGIMYSEGDCSQGGKVITTSAELDDPMSGQRVKMRQVTTRIDKDHIKYEAYAQNPQGEGEMKVMEILYTRM